MRYILNDSGFIETISFTYEIECNNKTCTEYTGTTPTGYETLAEWSENANINAYKIVDGNLTYDSEEDARLQSLWNSQEANSINTDAIDYTSQCTFKNCDFKGGAIYKISKIVFIQIYITATATHEWTDIIQVPDDLTPLVIEDNGTAIGGTEFWVYNTNLIKGSIEEGKNYAIVSSYLANN